ncbi:MAG: hypothetical protein HY560_11255 [Gemmatimonadetes bacterium]|nr:hypothetical protein [Gemmatimonadota bacterium]
MLREAGPEHLDRARVEALGRRAPRDWFACRRLRDRSIYLCWTDQFEFLVSPDGRGIHYRPLRHASAESLATYLLGQVLSFSLLAFRVEPLHGTAVVVDGKAIAFLGDCGSGKSTLGAAFLSRGYPVLTDDLLIPEPVRGGYAVPPGMPRIKLFPSVARRVLGRDGGSRLNHGTSKQVLPLQAGESCGRTRPLAALYVLSRPRNGGREIAAQPLAAADALLEVVRHTFNAIVFDRARLANQFTLASRLVSRVPVRRLTYPRSLARLPEVCEAVIRDGARWR